MYSPKGSIQLSSIDYSEQIRLGLQAPPKSGKTYNAASFPNPVYLSLDRGLGCLYGRVDVIEVPMWNPRFVDSLAERTDASSPPNRRDAVLQWLRTEAMKLEKEQTLVVDGGTGLQTAFHTQYWTAPAIDKEGAIKPYEEYKQKISFFSEITLLLKSLQCNVVYITHETADRNSKGDLNGLIRPLLSGQFVDELQSHFTDWFRCLTIAKPSSDKMMDFRAKFKLDAAGAKEWIDSNPTDTIYVWQTQSDELVKCGSSTLVGAPKYILADYKSFLKYGKKK